MYWKCSRWAANMQAKYKGFSILLNQHSPNQIHVWCYAHILNLVIADTTGGVLASASLFTLLNKIAMYIREKRVTTYATNDCQ